MIINSSIRHNKTAVFEKLIGTDQLHIIPNMTITASGELTKWIFAANFNHDGESATWPELQIWRRFGESGMQYRKIIGTSMRPRGTGYLNVFEYDLSEHPTEVKAGDVLGVYQPGPEAQYHIEFVCQ